MKLTVEISLYPLNENFIQHVKGFIAKLKSYEELSVLSNNVSTQISGEYDYVMQVLNNEIKNVFEEVRSVLVMKFLMGDKVND